MCVKSKIPVFYKKNTKALLSIPAFFINLPKIINFNSHSTPPHYGGTARLSSNGW